MSYFLRVFLIALVLSKINQSTPFKIQIGIFTDLTSTLLKGDLHETSNTSREVQDILGEFSVGPSGAPALPPKQNANSSSTNANASNTSSSSLNRPSSVQVNFGKNPVLKKNKPKNAFRHFNCKIEKFEIKFVAIKNYG